MPRPSRYSPAPPGAAPPAPAVSPRPDAAVAPGLTEPCGGVSVLPGYNGRLGIRRSCPYRHRVAPAHSPRALPTFRDRSCPCSHDPQHAHPGGAPDRHYPARTPGLRTAWGRHRPGTPSPGTGTDWDPTAPGTTPTGTPQTPDPHRPGPPPAPGPRRTDAAEFPQPMTGIAHVPLSPNIPPRGPRARHRPGPALPTFPRPRTSRPPGGLRRRPPVLPSPVKPITGCSGQIRAH